MKFGSLVFLLILSLSAFADDEGGVEEAEEDPYLYNEKNFNERLDSEPHFIMFYAPWCGHCKRLKPVWQELADFYNSKADRIVTIAKVDCTADTKICSENSVTGYPTLKLFPIGKEPIRFRGGRELESLKDFITKTLTDSDVEIEEKDASPPEVNDGLYEISSENFDSHVAVGNHFIKFFAPWCGHCKKMEPTWKELAENFKDTDRVKIGRVDCTKNSESCKANEVRGYPTLLWFKDGKKVEQYQGSRQLENFIDFIEKMVSSKAEEVIEHEEETVKQAEKQEPEEPELEGALELDADSFEETIASGVSFVKFYAPWCGHCKRLAPIWDELSREDFSVIDGPVRIIKVDCTKYQSLCAEYEVRGYPTLKLFIDGEEKEKYSGARNLESLKEFLLQNSGKRDQQKDEL